MIGPIWQIEAMSVASLPRIETRSPPRLWIDPSGAMSFSGSFVIDQPSG